jgi:hypothetical protein
MSRVECPARGYATPMTVESEENRPNEYGFAGDGTAPQPERTATDEGDGEDIAVPAGDLTGAITGAIDEAVARDDKSQE